MLLAGALVLMAYLLFALLWRPLATEVDSLERKNLVAKQSLIAVKSLAQEFSSLQQSATANSGGASLNLTRLIDNTVKKNKLTMNRFQPSSSGDVQVRFENAVFNQILAWLHELEVGNGVAVKDLSINPGSASGLVNVSVRLRQGA